MVIMDGKKLSAEIKLQLKDEVEEIKKRGILPKLAVIMVGEDKASKIYVKNKSIACKEVGLAYEEYVLDENIEEGKLLELIDNLNSRRDIHGILLQSPIPESLDINKALKRISPEKDVDGFNPVNVGKLTLGQEGFCPCTPMGVIELLKKYNIEIQGKHAVVIGRSNIVGKPMAELLLNENATVTICHSKTVNLKEFTTKADILISAIGKPKIIKADMVKENSVIIDVGINRMLDGKVVGDVDFEDVSKKVSYITPVPGGVGPMTIAMLMKNVVKIAQK